MKAGNDLKIPPIWGLTRESRFDITEYNVSNTQFRRCREDQLLELK